MTVIYEGSDELHTALYVTEKGDRIFIKMDASRPCKFNTTETRWSFAITCPHVENIFLQVL